MDNSIHFTEEILAAPGSPRLTDAILGTIQSVMDRNDPVGIAAGYYDRGLPICYTSRFFAESMGYGKADFWTRSGCSLEKLICTTQRFPFHFDVFTALWGPFRTYMLRSDGSPILMTCFKEETQDAQGVPMWVISARPSRSEQFMSLVEDIRETSQWFIDYDTSGNVLACHWDDRLLPMLGEPKGATLPDSRHLGQRIHPEDRPRIHKELADVFFDPSKGSYAGEFRLLLHNGDYKWVQLSCQAIRRTDGTVSRMVGLFLNVDQWKRTQLLSARQKLFHDAYASSNLCEVIVDLEADTYEAAKLHPAFRALSAAEPGWDAFVARLVRQFVPAEHRQAVLLSCDRAYIRQKLMEFQGEQCLEFRMEIGGQERWLRNVVLHGDTELRDTPKYAILFLRDITDVKQSSLERDRILQKNADMQRLMDTLVRQVEKYAVCDLKNDRYQLDARLGASGYRPEGTYGSLVEQICRRYRSLGNLKSLSELLSVDAIRQDIQDDDRVYKLECIAADGSAVKQLSFLPMAWENKVLTEVIMISADMTRTKQKEAQARQELRQAYDAANRANQAKSQFLANMSHDIRTPMNAIMGMTAIAKSSLEDPQRVESCLDTIRQSSKLLLGIIDEILDMSRIESGKLQLNPAPFLWPELVEESVSLVQEEIRRHGHRLELQLPALAHPAVIADRTRVQQILNNLLSNAIKYTPDGGHIRLSLEELSEKSPGTYRLRVEDDGIGIAPEFLGEIFQPFTREDSRRTTKIHGTGLGLSIVRNIVQMMNGEITVDSTPGKGSRFTVLLSLEIDQAPDSRPEPTDDEYPASALTALDLTGKHILLTEDNALNQEIAQELLRLTGTDVNPVDNGLQAFEAVRDPPGLYDLVFMDIQMPKMDGYEATRAIRSLNRKDTEQLPILALTANAFPDDVTKAKQAGMNGHLSKPLDLQKLAAALRQWLCREQLLHT